MQIIEVSDVASKFPKFSVRSTGMSPVLLGGCVTQVLDEPSLSISMSSAWGHAIPEEFKSLEDLTYLVKDPSVYATTMQELYNHFYNSSTWHDYLETLSPCITCARQVTITHDTKGWHVDIVTGMDESNTLLGEATLAFVLARLNTDELSVAEIKTTHSDLERIILDGVKLYYAGLPRSWDALPDTSRPITRSTTPNPDIKLGSSPMA